MRFRETPLKKHWDALSVLDPNQSIIDPNDSLGHKNRYIGEIRDAAFRESLQSIPAGETILDLGCGTGNASIGLLDSGWNVVGVDISLPLLRQARNRCISRPAIFVQSNGQGIPIKGSCMDAAVTYGVLIYATEDQSLLTVLREFCRVLKPGGTLVLVEQTRSRGKLTEGGLKRFRSPQEWQEMLMRAGFTVEACEIIRHGRFPGIHLVRYGLIPRRFWSKMRDVERAIGRVLGVIPGDYADLRIVARSARR